MKAFMDKDFLLETETAKHLFHDYAEKMPLVDYHCHLNPQEIYEDRRFNNLAEVWLGGQNPDGTFAGDHYKWRLMRSNGIDESYVTGNKPPYERFLKLAEALEMAIGNPMYHWCHLELKNYFGYDGVLCPETADEVWEPPAQFATVLETRCEVYPCDPGTGVHGMVVSAVLGATALVRVDGEDTLFAADLSRLKGRRLQYGPFRTAVPALQAALF